ncbi:hypothetical protein [Pseudoduganella violaceinigra]|uniref:hypothetical protein n=1 Tax=Pseudoduganella violaceinigra TaxID=246602 RepID=UPI000483E701|nr:hypothetical protein [Pseudoduganella violaceinigra]
MASREQLAANAVAKERLVRQGELYRLSALRAKHEVINALQPQALLHGALEHAVGALQSRLGIFIGQGGGLSGLSFKTVLPYALTLGSWIARKRMWKPAAAAGVLAAVGAWWLMRRKPDA